ncbi:hypothetical protein D5018_06495 [Parashewanella curva]|uniref:Uncharacterized protein n=1 Tax=Parashewanella curva TaxID=2338552 RepID=A0A3L8Q2I0_9GAMM|nr:hypothetical protein [Parashewanella curva]RLV60592.1 hypothetical protein D5018_06495 [Parashewanella curva]
MNSMDKKQLWYGELRTARGNTIVIHDQALPEASPGRIYLYNSTRESIIEYVKDIVENNLHDLDNDSLEKAQANYAEAWKQAKAEFMSKQKGNLDLSPEIAPVATKSDESIDIEEEPEITADVDDLRSDWTDEEYEE